MIRGTVLPSKEQVTFSLCTCIISVVCYLETHIGIPEGKSQKNARKHYYSTQCCHVLSWEKSGWMWDPFLHHLSTAWASYYPSGGLVKLAVAVTAEKGLLLSSLLPGSWIQCRVEIVERREFKLSFTLTLAMKTVLFPQIWQNSMKELCKVTSTQTLCMVLISGRGKWTQIHFLLSWNPTDILYLSRIKSNLLQNQRYIMNQAFLCT